MSRRDPVLAKLSRPRLFEALPRGRLFERIDDLAGSGAIWIAGPPGSGKTSLVASYIDESRRPCIWYKMDEGDGDLSTFYYYLNRTIRTRRATFPTKYEADDHQAFARRYFRHYFSLLEDRTFVVFDDYQDVPSESPLHAVLPHVLAETPSFVTVVVISRASPPPTLGRLRTLDAVALIAWEDLRFTHDETARIARREGVVDPAVVDRVQVQTGGWVAGVRLMLASNAGSLAVRPGGTQDVLFDYFAEEIFGRASPVLQDFWLYTALLPAFTVRQARELTGNSRAAQLIDDLYRRQLFIDRRAEGEAAYEYHGLFRGYLLVRLAARLTPERYRDLQMAAARLLAEDGAVDHAIGLYLAAHAWPEAGRLIVVQSPELLAHGRGSVVRDWVGAMAPFYVHGSARLLYCLGAALVRVDPDGAAAVLERAYGQFVLENNEVGQAMVAATIAECYYYRQGSYRGLETWIDRLVALLERGLVFPSPESELHVYTCFLVAATFRSPTHPFIPRCAERLYDMCGRGFEVNRSVMAGATLLLAAWWIGMNRCEQVISRIQPIFAHRELAPFSRLWWLLAEMQYWYFHGEPEARLPALLTEARVLAAKVGAEGSERIVLFMECFVGMAVGDLHAARASLIRIERLADPSRSQETILLRQLEYGLANAAGDDVAALEAARGCLEFSVATGNAASEAFARCQLASALAALGRFDECRAALESARARISEADNPKLASELYLVDALLQLRQGQCVAARENIARGFALGRRHAYLSRYFRSRPIQAEICQAAFAANIEVEYVRRLVREQRLAPGRLAETSWPWPLRIRTLGRFAIDREQSNIVVSVKGQRKPLELLQAIIAQGGRDVSAESVADELWPQSDGDAAQANLAMNVHRLRRLLGNDSAVRTHSGLLALDDAYCWIDIWAVDQLADVLETAGDQANPGEFQTLRTLYRGNFLEQESFRPWMAPLRDRLKGRMSRLVHDATARYAGRSEWASALEVLSWGVEFDPANEEWHQGIIRCHIMHRRRSEALEAYRSCSRVLLSAENRSPSEVTEKLRERAESLRRGP